jgi:hypothetical protein
LGRGKVDAGQPQRGRQAQQGAGAEDGGSVHYC